MKKIAIIGSGISGLTCAALLSKEHHITLFEANDYLGGHTATVDIEHDGKNYAIDTGFIVFNDQTYPNFIHLLEQNKVEYKETEMSFSIHHSETGIEYNGNNLSSLFAQRKNLINPRFYYFIYEIIRFNRIAKSVFAQPDANSQTLKDFLDNNKFSDHFAEHYILPMVAAIWSSSVSEAGNFPLSLFLSFFYHHGLLNIIDRPQWHVIKNGSRSYIPKLSQNIQEILLSTPVNKIVREQDKVKVYYQDMSCADVSCEQTFTEFDEVILACHSDQSLKLLDKPFDEEREILSAFAYQNNEVVLHTDTRLLPNEKRAWASWNFYYDQNTNQSATVTYNMNILQGIDAPETFCVSLNRTEDIDQDKILRTFNYAHPVYNEATEKYQKLRNKICGRNHTHFCGSYWYNGFHEDGVKSALDVCKRFGLTL
ncbi:MAG: FAD-dependent oxidoreductase [Gammaproteobacteria bacterium]|nr:FAD-dependent oxidoreductase [Gammaproteobacteria bacterium]